MIVAGLIGNAEAERNEIEKSGFRKAGAGRPQIIAGVEQQFIGSG